MLRKDDGKIESGAGRAPFAYSGGTAVLPSREVQHAWFELTRARPWRSVALVPVEDGNATLVLAHELAQMAALDPRNRVLVINATGMPGDEPTAAKVPASPGGAVPVASGKYHLLDCAKLGMDDATVGMVEVPKYVDQVRAGSGPYTMVIAATNSLLSRPAAVSTSRSVDAVVLCVALGLTSFASTKRSIELVGEESIVGTIALRPRG